MRILSLFNIEKKPQGEDRREKQRKKRRGERGRERGRKKGKGRKLEKPLTGEGGGWEKEKEEEKKGKIRRGGEKQGKKNLTLFCFFSFLSLWGWIFCYEK